MLALCFKCGHKKSTAMKLCGECHSVPQTEEDKILSMCLSLECVSEQTLRKCREHFKKKNKPPQFKEPIAERAKKFLEEQMDADSDQSIMFSASVMDFSDFEEESVELRKNITVHVIGKGPRQDATDANAVLGKAHKTCHRTQWTVGKDLSEEMYDANKDAQGDIYIWYRWLNNKWAWSCVSSSKFEQLKSVESGRMSL